jgi:predicted amidophosphoribosyltransferase
MRLLDVLVPARCVACGAGERLLCAVCRGSLRLLGPPLCARCGAPTAWPVERCSECSGRRLPFRTARAAVAYEGPARALVAGWKERGLWRLAAEAAGLVGGVVPAPNADAVVFVPADLERTLWRGHASAAQLARALAELWGLPVVPALTRPARTPRQRGLSRVERRANVRGSFRAVRAPPARVVLVDDVYTTGATVSAAATELRRAGARTVDVVTFARAIRSR